MQELKGFFVYKSLGNTKGKIDTHMWIEMKLWLKKTKKKILIVKKQKPLVKLVRWIIYGHDSEKEQHR